MKNLSVRTPASLSLSVDDAIRSRRSVRQFLPTPVDRQLVEQILELSARAPSGHNTQPWRVHAVSGDALATLRDSLCRSFLDDEEAARHAPAFDSYPAEWTEPYLGRRRQVGHDMYGILGIPRGDMEGMRAQAARNFEFFGAPLALIFTAERSMLPGSALDVGMFMQNVMLAARSHALDSCPQAALARFHRIIARDLSLPPDEVVLCGMSLGYADTKADINRLETTREQLAGFVAFHT
ncbi:nitroreductase [Pseudorhodoferax sp.]|uniref:nitroreductase n=1 Tax=Pseudorhodoferax sp. TaxID=1993553 RepID=UPI002DD63B25|nr:nitroreductase [Pseudorhodoferax sp.]